MLEFAGQQFLAGAHAHPAVHHAASLVQRLFQDLEAQVVALGQAEARVAVRKGLLDAGAAVAAALVEGDQFVAHVDHGHAHRVASPFLAHDALGLGQHLLAEAAALAAAGSTENMPK